MKRRSLRWKAALLRELPFYGKRQKIGRCCAEKKNKARERAAE